MKRFLSILIILLMSCSAAFAQTSLDKKLSQHVSANFQGASVSDILRIWASQYNLNLVAGEAIKGRVNIQLTDVELGDALNTILKSYGYHYIVKNNILLVKPFDEKINGELENQVIKLKYLDGFQLKPTIEPLLSEKGKIEPLISELPKSKDNKTEDQRADAILVSDVWENVQKIEKVVTELDSEPAQLQIEVKLVEVSVGVNDQVGFNWPKKVTASVTGAETTAPITKSNNGSNNQQRYLSGWYEIPGINDRWKLGVLTFDEMQATLAFLAQDNNSRLVSNPKVTTQDNKKATIEVATLQPIPEVSRGISGDLITYREKPIGMMLEVIPRVSENDMITMNIHPVLEDIIGYVGPVDYPQPVTSKREVSTQVTVKEGESLAIGGLLKTTETKAVEKVWLLGDIPLLGYLFRHTTTRKEKTDLLIFITPQILKKR